eukprot:1159870-Pelagomonas_calceolata.AAC.3
MGVINFVGDIAREEVRSMHVQVGGAEWRWGVRQIFRCCMLVDAIIAGDFTLGVCTLDCAISRQGGSTMPDCRDAGVLWQQLFQRPYFAINLLADVPGAEMCGTLKNIVAVGAGMGDGLGIGECLHGVVQGAKVLSFTHAAQEGMGWGNWASRNCACSNRDIVLSEMMITLSFLGMP